MSALFDREFLFVAGKGGVGKTTVSAALALAAAKRGKRVLVAMCNTKERLSSLLGVQPIGPRNQPILENIDAVNMTPAVALEEYGMMVLKVRSVYKAVFENRFVSAVLRGTPGIEAWAMLGKAQFHVAEQIDGRPRYDLVIVDGPATGHALDMLRVPQVICDVAPPGLLRTEAQKTTTLFHDRARAAAILVTLPEDMPTNETIELHTAITSEIGLEVAALVVNSMLPKLFKRAERDAIIALPSELPEGSALVALAQAGRERAVRERTQREAMKKLSAAIPEVPRVTLPHLFTPEFDRSSVESLSATFVD